MHERIRKLCMKDACAIHCSCQIEHRWQLLAASTFEFLLTMSSEGSDTDEGNPHDREGYYDEIQSPSSEEVTEKRNNRGKKPPAHYRDKTEDRVDLEAEMKVSEHNQNAFNSACICVINCLLMQENLM